LRKHRPEESESCTETRERWQFGGEPCPAHAGLLDLAHLELQELQTYGCHLVRQSLLPRQAHGFVGLEMACQSLYAIECAALVTFTTRF